MKHQLYIYVLITLLITINIFVGTENPEVDIKNLTPEERRKLMAEAAERRLNNNSDNDNDDSDNNENNNN